MARMREKQGPIDTPPGLKPHGFSLQRGGWFHRSTTSGGGEYGHRADRPSESPCGRPPSAGVPRRHRCLGGTTRRGHRDSGARPASTRAKALQLDALLDGLLPGHIPPMQEGTDRLLILSQDLDTNVLMCPSRCPKKEIEGPPTCDPPRSRQREKEAGDFIGVPRMPHPKVVQLVCHSRLFSLE